jgi:predicted transcriptional regulator
MENSFFEDSRISMKAKGILGYLLTKPDYWKLQVNDIVKHCTEGRSSIYSGIKELMEAGYIFREEIRIDGNFSGYNYYIFENPNLNNLKSPHSGNTDTVFTDTVFTNTQNCDISNN